MVGSFIIVFREMLEAGLIIGIALAATRTVPGAGRWLAAGAVIGLAGSLVVALFTGLIASAFAGSGQEVFNASVLGLAVVMLAWHNIWMARHGREMAQEMKATGRAIAAGSRSVTALALVVGLAVLREGSEVVLFLYGLMAVGGSGPLPIALGSAGGVLAGGAVSALIYFGLLALPVRHLFTVTGAIITFLAAGMAAQAVAFLEQAGIVTAFGEELWDSSAFLSQSGPVGSVLHVLLGYMDRPTGAEFLAWAITLVTIAVLTRVVNRPTGTAYPAAT